MEEINEAFFEDFISSFEWENELSKDTYFDFDSLYHYYSGRSVRRVFQKDKVVFRLAAASTFPDKMEGKSLEVYYDLALKELLVSARITEDQFFAFSSIHIPDSMMLSYQNENGFYSFSDRKFREYIICFSTEKDNKYLYEKYINDSDGYCLEFSSIELQELKTLGWNNFAKIEIFPILYGEQVVEYIKLLIIKVIENKKLLRNYSYYISEALRQLQYKSKLSKFSKDKEIRIIVYIEDSYEIERPDIKYASEEKDGKLIEDRKYIYFSVTKDVFSGISFAPYNNLEENNQIIEFLKRNKYELNNGVV